MNNVTRYEFEVYEGGGETVISETGGFVDYDDYLSQLQQKDALQTSLNNIINAFGIKGEGAHSKLVIEYVHGLVAENAALKKCCEAYDADGLAEYGDQWEVTPLETPDTDAAIAEIKAQGVDEFAETLGSPYEERGGRTYEDGFTRAVETIKVIRAPVFAQHLRSGRKG
ncbi:hypothetical protein M2403_001998 [Rahnella sp. BIGb0603]|uniref:hypothetical protein n=1 Tax=Rahnella sp. BIGb0603 TaxID=2940612 RepID=UPI002169E414|nr:hypothetical protein [Rahnella sp. BIGb0603]MCS3423397.1 hypothetical protein [Rahnella sp. BIGb0603]